MPARSHNLPAHLPTLIGREEAVAAVGHRLLEAQPGLLTLTGAGGSGKTRLALAVAMTLADRFPDGVWFVELAPLVDAGLVPGAVAASVGVPEQPWRKAEDTLLEALQLRSMLLVLDNCEHLVDACAALADDLLQGCPGLRILATSREPLRMSRETIWRVPPLSAPDPRRVPTIEELAGSPAVRLFVERAQTVRPAFALTDQNGPAIARICARLDGLPLAVELAAARVRVLGPDQILARLDDVFGVLTGGSRTAPTRQQTMRASLDWSFGLLGPAEQRLFEQLAVFAGGFNLEAAEAICAGQDPPRSELVDVLTGLVDKSLVVAQEQDQVMRYWLLEPVRQYAQARLTAQPGEVTRQRHTAYFLALAERSEHGLRGTEQEAWVARLEREHDNLRAVLRRCLEAGEPEPALRIGSALMHFWRHAGYRNEGQRWLEEGLERGAEVAAPVRAKALRQAGVLAYRQSNYRRARAHYEQALALFRLLNDAGEIATTLDYFGWLVVRTARAPDESARGMAMLEEALALRRVLDDRYGVAGSLHTLGQAAWEQANLERARVAFEESATLFEQIGEHHVYNHVIFMAGGVARDQGDFDLASRLLNASLAESRRIACASGTEGALYQLAGLARCRGDAEAAVGFCLESLALNQQLRQHAELAGCLELLGGLACDDAQPEWGVRLFAAAATLREQIGVPVPAVLAPRRERDLAHARTSVGPARFAAAWSTGRSLTVEQVIEEAERGALHSTQTREARSDQLSRRERDVARLLARGVSNRQIALQLVISERTADGHVANILGKLGLKNRAQVAIWAVEHQHDLQPAPPD